MARQYDIESGGLNEPVAAGSLNPFCSLSYLAGLHLATFAGEVARLRVDQPVRFAAGPAEQGRARLRRTPLSNLVVNVRRRAPLRPA